MCRLLAFAGKERVGIFDLIDPAAFEHFVDLAEVHKDGWGLAYTEDDDAIRVVKSPKKASSDPAFRTTMGSVKARTAALHLRWAYGEHPMPATFENAHPFFTHDVAFAHNGTIDGAQALMAHIAPKWREAAGNTDSEKMFRLLLTVLERVADVPEAFSETLRVIKQECSYSGLNVTLVTQSALYIACVFDPEHSPILEEDPTFYGLHYRIREGDFLIASSGWTEVADWPFLQNGEMMVVDRESLDTSIVRVG